MAWIGWAVPDDLCAQETRKQKPVFDEFMGINGHTVLFRPKLYRPTCAWVRDYHPVDWDLGDRTDQAVEFPFARNRVNWDSVYGSWSDEEWKVDVCLMFDSMPVERWSDLEKDAYQYGKAFASAFGPSSKRPLVRSVEIGNEPGKLSDDDYRKLFQAMARGVRAGDPKLMIATCNVNVGASGDYHKSIECVRELEDLYDVINVHSYAMLEQWPTWKRSFPEDPKLPQFWKDIDEVIAWRDRHAPSKQVWLTEFGWDACSKLPSAEGDFAKWQGNSELEQSQWIVRTFLLLAARDVDKAFLFFFNDQDEPKLHGASGLTRNFEPKPAYYAMRQLYQNLQSYRFERVVQQTESLSVMSFQNREDARKRVWVCWSPTGIQKTMRHTIDLGRATLQRAERMSDQSEADVLISPKAMHGVLEVEVSESPVYLFLE